MRAAWWWIDRWRKSTAFICMNAEQQGIYRNLLDAVWLFPNHVIPDTQRALEQASGCSPQEWERSGAFVLRWMQKVDDGWTNETALEVIASGDRIRDARSNAGKRGAESRWQTHGKRDSKTMANACPPSPNSELRTSEAEQVTHTRPSARLFDRFWEQYPRKVGKRKAEKAWKGLKPDEALVTRMLAALEWQRGSEEWRRDGGRFIPHPSSWLGAARWEDERPSNGRSDPDRTARIDKHLAELDRLGIGGRHVAKPS